MDLQNLTATEVAATIGKNILFWSNYVVQWIVTQLEATGIGFKAWQVSALLIIVNLVLLFFALKITKPILKWIIILLLLWILIGFFVPVGPE